jgi:hypothetical protein
MEVRIRKREQIYEPQKKKGGFRPLSSLQVWCARHGVQVYIPTWLNVVFNRVTWR